jgi:outer membrane lipoprotein-sorting protein
MKKIVLPVFAFVLLGGLLCAPLAGNLRAQTLEEVLAKNYQAHGGLDKLKAITSWKMKGKIVIPAQGMEMPMEMWQKSPDKMRVEAVFQGKKIVQAYDGRKAWWIMPFLSEEPQEMSPEQAKLFKEQADFENPLVVYKQKGYKLELLGKEDMEGTPVFKLKLTKTDGKEILFYLDAESGIELKSSMSMKVGEADALVEVLYGDYKLVDGHMMPFAIENKTNGQTQMQMTMESVEINPALDDSFFSMPEMKEAPKAEAAK